MTTLNRIRFGTALLVAAAAGAGSWLLLQHVLVQGANVPTWRNPPKYYWPDWVLLFLQAATLIALVIYVWKTWQMAAATRDAATASAATLREAQEARLEALAPRVLIFFAADSRLAEIVVTNAGQGTATDVSFNFDPPLQSSQQDRTPGRFFERPKPMLPPGYRLSHFFDVWASYLQSSCPRAYRVTVRYAGAENGKQYSVVHTLDVSAIEYLVTITRKTVHELTNELEKLRTGLESRTDRVLRTVSTLHASHAYVGTGVALDSAVAQLQAEWRFYRAAYDDPQAVRDGGAIHRALTAAAANTLHAAYRERSADSDCVAAAVAVAVRLLAADTALQLDEWIADMDKLIPRLVETATPRTSVVQSETNR